MIEIRLSPSQWEELIKKGYSLDIIYLLKMLKEEYIMEEVFSSFRGIPKIVNIEQSVIRKGLVTTEGKVTLEGEELLKFLSSKEEKPKLVKKKPPEDSFTLFWSTFPGTDSFSYKGRKFAGTRALKAKKEECRIKLNKILGEGEFSINDIIEALKLEISQKKESSFKTGDNKLKYLQNSFTWLHQRGFESFIELVKEGHKAEEEVKNATSGGVEI